MSEITFHSAMVTLHKQLGLDPGQSATPENNTYTLSVGPIEIELLGTQAGFINVLCFPGEFRQLSTASLAVLLSANRYQEDHPVITASLLDGPPHKVVLWSRIPLAAASPDTLGKLFVRFTEVAQATQQWIDAGAPGLGGAKKDATKSSSARSPMARFQSSSQESSFGKNAK